MKASFLIFVSLIYFSTNVLAQSIAINATGSNPDTTAMLDIQSTSKGILVPRLSTIQRQGISNPAEGLLVFDTGLMSFVFFQGGLWVELVNATSGLRDADNDTRISVEETVDEDTIRFFVKGNEFARMDGKSLHITSNSGIRNTYIGNGSGENSVSSDNTFLGFQSGMNNNSNSNTFLGSIAGASNQNGSSNTFIGSSAGASQVFGNFNTFIGTSAGASHVEGSFNTFIGMSAGRSSNGGHENTFIGYQSGFSSFLLGTGVKNTLVGNRSGFALNSGIENAILGESAGRNLRTGSINTYLGTASGFSNEHGNGNVFLGYKSGYFETGNNKLYIANSDDTTPLIYGDFGANSATVHGNLGINTKVPAFPLHIVKSGTGGSPTINLVVEANTSNRPTILFSEAAPTTGLGNGMSIEYNGAVTGNEMRINAAGGAPVLTVESTDKQVGIGTTDPAFPLHIADNGISGSPTINLVVEANTSKRPTILFSENSAPTGLSDGMSISYNGAASGNEMTINDVGGAPVLTVESTDRQVGIGTINPVELLEVSEAGNARIRVTSTNSTAAAIDLVRSSTNNTDWRIENSGNLKFFSSTNLDGGVTQYYSFGIGTFKPSNDNSIQCGSSSSRWSVVFAANGTIQTSDIRFKKEVKTLSYGLREVLRMRPVSYFWKDDSDSRKHVGLIAQEIQQVIPEVVHDSDPDHLGMNYAELVPVLVNAIQELSDKVEKQQVLIDTLVKEYKLSKSSLSTLKDNEK